MSVIKRRIAAGEKSEPIPAHGGMYRMSDTPGFSWIGQGPRPHYKPTRVELVKAHIDPELFAAELLRATGLDLTEALGTREEPHEDAAMDRTGDVEGTAADGGDDACPGRRRVRADLSGDCLPGQMGFDFG